MQLPADLYESCVNVTYPGPAAGTVVGNIVASPAAGLRYRLWAVAVATVDPTQAVGKWTGGPAIGEGTYWLFAASANGMGGGTFWWPGGLHLAEGDPIAYRLTADEGPVTIRIMCYYSREYA